LSIVAWDIWRFFSWSSEITFIFMGSLIVARIQTAVVPALVAAYDLGDELPSSLGVVPLKDFGFFKAMMKMALVYSVVPIFLIGCIEILVFWLEWHILPQVEMFDEMLYLHPIYYEFLLESLINGLAYCMLAYFMLLVTRSILMAFFGASLMPLIADISLWSQYAGSSFPRSAIVRSVLPTWWIYGNASQEEIAHGLVTTEFALVLILILIPSILAAINWRRRGRFSLSL
jgi:hypothetical protein